MQVHSQRLTDQEFSIDFMISIIVDHSLEHRKVIAIVSHPSDRIASKVVKIFANSNLSPALPFPRARFGVDKPLFDGGFMVSFGKMDRLCFINSSAIMPGFFQVFTTVEN